MWPWSKPVQPKAVIVGRDKEGVARNVKPRLTFQAGHGFWVCDGGNHKAAGVSFKDAYRLWEKQENYMATWPKAKLPW